MVQEDVILKISYLELWWPFCSVEWNHLRNFGRGHYGKPVCEFILNLDHGSGGDVVQRKS